jgi:polyhydroxyalkanoate synthesis regulator phasin
MNSSLPLLLILLLPFAHHVHAEYQEGDDAKSVTTFIKNTTVEAFEELNIKLSELAAKLKTSSRVESEKLKEELIELSGKISQLSAKAKGKSYKKLRSWAQETHEIINQLKTATVEKTQHLLERLANLSQEMADTLHEKGEEINK